MTLPARPLLIAAALAVPALAAVLLLSAGGSLGAADRRLIDRWDETVETCFDDEPRHAGPLRRLPPGQAPARGDRGPRPLSRSHRTGGKLSWRVTV